MSHNTIVFKRASEYVDEISVVCAHRVPQIYIDFELLETNAELYAGIIRKHLPEYDGVDDDTVIVDYLLNTNDVHNRMIPFLKDRLNELLPGLIAEYRRMLVAVKAESAGLDDGDIERVIVSHAVSVYNEGGLFSVDVMDVFTGKPVFMDLSSKGSILCTLNTVASSFGLSSR